MVRASRPPAASPPERSIPATERLEKAAAAEVEMSRGGTFSGEPSSEPSSEGKAETMTRAATRMHVRVGLGGLEDADRGQEPTVWAVAGGRSRDVKGENKIGAGARRHSLSQNRGHVAVRVEPVRLDEKRF